MSFFIRINDFSTSWYINVEDPDSLYVAELGRRISDNFFINLASSNYTVTPGENISTNTSAYFVNYKDLKNGKLDITSGNVYETYDFKSRTQEIIGISSPELFRMSMHQQAFGISSAELFGISLVEHLGISSQSFIK